VASEVETVVKYAGYLERQQREVERVRRMESVPIPPATDYDAVPGLSVAARRRLKELRPPTLGHASRMEDITPSALSALALSLRRR
jgi:tRNA uridine 5-carboxymethylaminomethyl modification enzyme